VANFGLYPKNNGSHGSISGRGVIFSNLFFKKSFMAIVDWKGSKLEAGRPDFYVALE
jgi:hypothetical protein